jgi:hypothetical protein
MVRAAFGDEAGCNASRLTQLAASFRHAQAASRPLLVLVIPVDDAKKWSRGEAFGELLNHGGDRDLAPLASVEVVCGTMRDLRKLVPTVGVGEPLMVLVQTDRVPAAVRQLDCDLDPGPSWRSRGDYKDLQRLDEETSNQHIGALGALLRKELGDDASHAARLAAAVRARITAKPPAGASWAKSQGCGIQIEGDDPVIMGCGMGHTPAKAQRFLYFFTRRI